MEKGISGVLHVIHGFTESYALRSGRQLDHQHSSIVCLPTQPSLHGILTILLRHFLNEFSGGHNSFSELTHVKRYPCGSRGLVGRSKSCSEWKHLKSDVCKVPRFVKTISLLPALLRPWTVQKQGAPFLAKIAQRRMLQCSSACCGVGNFCWEWKDWEHPVDFSTWMISTQKLQGSPNGDI